MIKNREIICRERLMLSLSVGFKDVTEVLRSARVEVSEKKNGCFL